MALSELEEFEFRARAEQEAAQAEKPAKPKREVTSKTDRFLTGLMDPVVGAAQIMEKTGVPGLIRNALNIEDGSTMADVVKQRDADYVEPEGIDWMRMGGNAANPISWVGGGPARTAATRAAGEVAARVLPRAMQTATARAAGTGATQAMLTPTGADEDFWKSKAKQAALGGALGGAAGKLIGGATPTANARTLMDAGIQPTFGQGKGGWIGRTEEKLQSVPFIGDAITHARARPLREFEGHVLEQATGRAGLRNIDEANQIASRQFEDLVPHLNAQMPALDETFQQMALSQRNPHLDADAKEKLAQIVGSVFENFDQITPQGLKRIDAELGHMARQYSGPLKSVSEQQLGRELNNIKNAFRRGLEMDSPPGVGDALSTANRTFARLVPANDAASAVASERILPRAYQKAVARQQKQKVTRARIDDVTDAAVDTLPNKYPDSGTAGRLAMLASEGVGGAALGILPHLAAGSIPAIAGSSRLGQAAMFGNTRAQRAMLPHTQSVASIMAAAMRGEL